MRIGEVDPFVGCEPADLAVPTGIAATWWWPKPPIGNTHPGASYPFGMVSACPTSGAYPTGYGRYDRSTEGVPARLHDSAVTSGVTHFHQSGTGAIRKYYNYLRVTPMLDPLDELGRAWALVDESASPGLYTATLENGIRCEVTVGPRSSIHRYTFPSARSARIVLDCSHGGIDVDQGQTVPLRAELHALDLVSAAGTVVMEGVPVSFHAECDGPDWRLMPWYDRRLMHGGTQLRFDSIRPTTLRPFGFIWMGRVEAGTTVEIRLGFSLRGTDQAAANLEGDLVGDDRRRPTPADSMARTQREPAFDDRRRRTEWAWREHLGRVDVAGGTDEQRGVLATALYHSMLKPNFAPGESPFWDGDGPFVYDLSTMWDLYRTHLPLLTALFPSRAVELANALIQICESEGNFPIGYRMARGADRFARQGTALAHTFLADLCHLDLPGIDWEWALSLMSTDLNRTMWGEEFLEGGLAHPVTHTLDLGIGHHCTAVVARRLGDHEFAERLDALAGRWVNAYEPDSGLVVDSQYYEGGKWNYSFRLLHDMARRIELAGGDDGMVELLDRFFGFGADPVKQLGVAPAVDDIAAGYALHRFQGLNNEPDMDAPWCYHHAGRPDRTADVVRSVIDHAFGPGPGGLPGNDDSGGLSSWYVWATSGLFPQPGQQSVLIGPPAFPELEFTVGDGERTFAVRTRGADPSAIDGGAVDDGRRGRVPTYVASAHLDGTELTRSWLGIDEVATGGELVLELTTTPTEWGRSPRPPSITPHPHPSA
ncbi:MAG: glycoside hydrolase domain-containing protein [Actinomycetota bacterium]